jgi:hypothetical protein
MRITMRVSGTIARSSAPNWSNPPVSRIHFGVIAITAGAMNLLSTQTLNPTAARGGKRI